MGLQNWQYCQSYVFVKNSNIEIKVTLTTHQLVDTVGTCMEP